MSVERARLRSVLAGVPPTEASVGALAAAEAARLGSEGVRRRRSELRSELLGLGPLDELVHDPAVSDVAVNGDGSVWCDDGGGMSPRGFLPGGSQDVRRLAVRLAAMAGRRLDDAAPYVDGLLPGGVRLHAVLPPLVADGAHVTLRVPARRELSLADLAALGSFPREWVPLLVALVRRRVAFLVSGGTGAGKTTLLAALLGAGDSGDRVVVVEDVRELLVDRPHVVRMEARAPNVEGVGAVTLSVLVRQALRMRPDRLVVGEVRGPEVRELLTALNTGHEGGCGTLHANAAEDVVTRLVALGALADLTPAAVHAQVASAVQVVLHLRREGAARVLDAWGIVTGEDPPRVHRALDRDGPGPTWPRLAELLGVSRC